ncbi:TPA: hypothetical protein N0F65_012231 [Lagenidium giganteum]|uniref:RRM domain-containing protein n=1 Tax=Lagenidium giganteum TaxID=4803 RepID=A0AAV2ZB44_9STRA|nr:TPA: hypothetical protein N0F65_012231 [Lagenidium giganteum]
MLLVALRESTTKRSAEEIGGGRVSEGETFTMPYSTGAKRHMQDGGDGGGANKRSRGGATESRVVFVRGLPPDCLESELLALCCPFAVVEKSLLIPQKCQAFVQLPDVQSATNLITFYQSRDAMIRGKKIFFEFSSRDEITVRPQFDHQVKPEQLQPRESRHKSRQESRHESRPDSRQESRQLSRQEWRQDSLSKAALQAHQPSNQSEGGRRGSNAASGNTILMVSVTKIEYDVTVDVLQQVFQKFGNVQKVVTFWKNNEFKALVQMETVDQAKAAQAALDGRDIYTGCNNLGIVFSRHPELRVRYNNDRSRDYTNPNLPQGPTGGEAEHDEHLLDPEPQPGMLGDMPRDNSYMPPQRASDRREYDYGRAPAATAQSDFDRGYKPRDERSYDGRSNNRYDDSPQPNDPAHDFHSAHLPPHSTGRSTRPDKRPSAVLICSGMDSRLVHPDRLFTFFGCFGDVVRVKIMFRKQDTALIQFVDEVHATSALDHLDGVYIFAKKLRVDFSKHLTVSMPRGEVDRFELENTRDYSNSPLHRYRRRSPQEAVSPCPLLHISGIPIELQRNQNSLLDLFAQYGYIKNFHYIQKNTKMALLEMGTLDEAVMALLCLDNISYPDSHMRISFSKAYQFTATAASGGAGSGPASHHQQYGHMHGGGPPPSRSNPRDRSRDRDRERDRPLHDRDMRDRYGRGGGSMGGGGDRGGFRDRDRGGRGGDRRPPPRY